MTQGKIWLSPPHMNGNEQEFIQDAFDNNWISPYGENIDAFGKQLEEYFQAEDVVLVNSGTSAIHLSLILSDVKDGDEVIVQTLNFAGCINPIIYQNAVPLMIDSERDTWNIDPEIAEQVIEDKIKKGKKPKAIIGVHLFGVPSKIDELIHLSEKYDITFIEDAADAIGSTYHGKPVGSFGEFGIISFNGNKIVTTSGGGALIAKDPKKARIARHLSNQARLSIPHYVHDAIGYNYMMSNVLAGIGRGQMQVLDERIRRRREIYENYKKGLANIPHLTFIDDLENVESNRWLSVVLVNDEDSGIARNDIFWHLADNNIESRSVWTPMHKQPAFKAYPYFGANVAESYFNKGLCLPSGSSMTDSEQERVIEAIQSVYKSKKVKIPVENFG